MKSVDRERLLYVLNHQIVEFGDFGIELYPLAELDICHRPILRGQSTRQPISGWIVGSYFSRASHFFFREIDIPPRTTVSKFGSDVIAFINGGWAIRRLMLWAKIKPPGRSNGKSLFK